MAGESQQVPESAPDPSVYTMEAIGRASKAERDYVAGEIRVLAQRLADMDEATKVLNETVTRVPTETQKAVSHLHELTDEKFKSFSEQLQVERELRKEQKVDRKVELDAALSAAKDLSAQQASNFSADTAKTEDRFNKALIAQGETFSTAIAGQTREMNDVKDRLTRMESIKVGGQESKAAIYAALFAVIAVVSIIITIVVATQP